MPETQMPPQYARGDYPDPHDTEGKVAQAISREAGDRLQLWTTYVLLAISEFETAANAHIADLEYEHDASFSFDPVLTSFVSVAASSFEVTATAASIFETLMGGIQSRYEQNLETGMSNAKKKLRASLVAFTEASRGQITDTASQLLDKLPEIVDDAMTWVDSASTDPGYVDLMCDWMGFALPTRQNTINDVRQSLENPFFGIYQSVRAQLLSTQGVPGLDDDDLSPTIWQHDAVKRQRELYKQDGPDAWKEAYAESD